jgi:5,5'-dehydrodivanillate O-demethylase
MTELIDGQDLMVWTTQGPVAERPLERLGESDKGVILYRRLLKQQMELVQDGGEPMNVFRDPAGNQRLSFVREAAYGATSSARARWALRYNGTRFSPVLPQIEELYLKAAEASKRS